MAKGEQLYEGKVKRIQFRIAIICKKYDNRDGERYFQALCLFIA